MKLAVISCVVFTVISVLTGTTDAGVTGWTTPVIGQASGSAALSTTKPENTAAGSLSITIAATSSGSTRTYAITSQPKADKITIDSNSGLLSLAANEKFDFETEPTYVMVITCKDTSDNGVGTATVTLSITNVNEAPTFAKDQYSVTIPDGSKEGTALITVTATDEDASDTVTYSITGGNSPQHWAIASTGKLTVKAGITLDQKTLGGYSLEITATDAASLTDTAKVWVAVTTCNSGYSVAATISSGFMIFVALATQWL